MAHDISSPLENQLELGCQKLLLPSPRVVPMAAAFVALVAEQELGAAQPAHVDSMANTNRVGATLVPAARLPS
jgi:hypothetical protein